MFKILIIFFRLERIADEDYKVADMGIVISKDMLVYVPVYAMHRDPKLYPDPEKFDPDRYRELDYKSISNKAGYTTSLCVCIHI